MSKRIKTSSIRIIAGRWRGSRLPVLDHPGLRPTTDRVRETLFNWLMHDIAGARCLDLFCGSGALGLESLSRGAQFVQFIDLERRACQNIEQNLLKLHNGKAAIEESANLIAADSLKWLSGPATIQFDIVYLDPPFQADLLVLAAQLLEKNNWLTDSASIYLEYDATKLNEQALMDELPDNWQLIRQGKAGQCGYVLCQRDTA